MKKLYILVISLILLASCKSFNNQIINNSFENTSLFAEYMQNDLSLKNKEQLKEEVIFPAEQVLDITDLRKDLTRQYCIRHYHFDSYLISNLQMAIIHFTGKNDLKNSMSIYKNDIIPETRVDIKDFGKVNIGVHYIVDKDGTIYSLLPENMVGRHTVGFNHISIAIENVAASEYELTQKQVEANALLISYLAGKYPSLRFLFGHHEYLDKNKPHSLYFRAKDVFYRPKTMVDPGSAFMFKLRKHLLENYNLKFIE